MRYIIAIFLLFLFATSCGKHDFVYPDDDNSAEILFVNESKYSVSIHNSSFSGPIIVDKLAPGDMYSVEFYPSNNHGVGSAFPIRYWYRMEDTWIGGTNANPDAQILLNIEAGKNYVIYITQPPGLVGVSSYIKIKNNSAMSIEYNRLGTHYRQVNGELPVPSGQTGVYEIIDSSPLGAEHKNYTVYQVIDNYYPIPDFIAVTGYIYNFEFDGTQVIQKEVEKI